MLGLGIDITDRKRAEEALRQTESRLTRTEAFSLVMVTHVGLDGRWLKVPRTLCELLGYSEEELLSDGFKDVTHSDDFEAYWSQCLRLIRGEIRSFDLEKRYLHKNGSTIWAYVNCSIVEDDQGTPVHLLTYIRDITDRKRAEQALLESNERLIESNQQIRALAARLITAQESERRRISLLLHDDVSQKIAALGVVVSRLKRKLPTSNIDMVAELNQFGIHLNDLTTQIRHLSHQLHPEVLEHIGLVAALESVVREFGHDEGIELSFKSRVQSEPISLELSTCLYHVAFEAMRNISKHSNASSGTISLAEDEGFLTLEVSDSGRGFDVERAKRGSGIGLISAEERVKVLCGTFEVSSTPHQGTTIVARVPLGR
jgi:PAS domain S-box-containing protein